MADLRASIHLDLAGNIDAQGRAYAKSVESFAANARGSLAMLNRGWQVTGAGVDALFNKWTALGGGVAAFATGRGLVSMDERLDRIAIRANITADGVGQLKDQILTTANDPDIKLGTDQLMDGIEAIMAKGGSLEFARSQLKNVGITARATGESAGAIGELVGEIHNLGVNSPRDMMAVIDSWNLMAKKSGMSLGDMMSKMQPLLNQYKAFGREGPDAAREMGAAMSMLKDSLGDPEKAGMAYQRILQTFETTDKVRLIKQQLGVDIFDPEQLTKNHRLVMRNLDDVLQEIIQKTHGDQGLINKIFGRNGSTWLAPLMTEFTKGAPMDAMSRYYKIVGDGTQTEKDAARASDNLGAALKSIHNDWQQLADSEVGKSINEIAHGINSLQPGTVQTWMKWAEGVGGVLLTIYGINKTVGLVKDAKGVLDFVLHGKKGGVAGALGSMAGVTPVYVVNMGPGGMGGGGMPGAAGGAGGSIVMSGWRGALAGGMRGMTIAEMAEMFGVGAAAAATSVAVGAAALTGGAAGYGTYKLGMDDNKSGDFSGKVAVALMAFLGSEEARQAISDRTIRDLNEAKRIRTEEDKVHVNITIGADGRPRFAGVTTQGDRLKPQLWWDAGTAAALP